MTRMSFLSRSLLALGFVPAMAFAATATSPFGPSVVTAGVMCPPGITQTTNDSVFPIFGAAATVSCANGTSSYAWANSQSIALSGDSFNGSISGAPSAVTDLLPLVTPTQAHSRVRLTVETSHVDDFSLNWARLTFNVSWYGTDPGTALHLRIWEEYPRNAYVIDLTHIGPIDLQQTFIIEGMDVLDYRVEGWVVATSTPEPGTALLAGAALVIVGCYRHRHGRRL